MILPVRTRSPVSLKKVAFSIFVVEGKKIKRSDGFYPGKETPESLFIESSTNLLSAQSGEILGDTCEKGGRMHLVARLDIFTVSRLLVFSACNFFNVRRLL